LPVISQLDSEDQQQQPQSSSPVIIKSHKPLPHQKVDSPPARKWSAVELEKRGEWGENRRRRRRRRRHCSVFSADMITLCLALSMFPIFLYQTKGTPL
jgi:hypothetical protein